ncbi:hypothetical protein [Parasitella parasitica]|uniref:Uncharacterized protein n=1 Tax=Parasitella parasitica TaxID=35722 RepID=A0A0B7N3K3_9FUNG|nr:hypothetical protein [Parasitella parasitica]
MALQQDNAADSLQIIPYHQPPTSNARELPLPKRRSKKIRFDRSAKCKGRPAKKIKKVETPSEDAAIPTLSESSSCNSETISCQYDPVILLGLDEDDAKLVAALLEYDPSLALILTQGKAMPQ